MRPRLDDRDAVDVRVHERVRVATHNGVDALGDSAREIDDLSVATSVGAGGRVAERAGVRDDDDGVSAARPQRASAFVDDRCRRSTNRRSATFTAMVVRGVSTVETPITPTLSDPTRSSVSSGIQSTSRPVRELHVRAEHRIVRLTHPRAQRVASPVPFVIAERGGRVAERVVELDDGGAVRAIRRRRALEHVAAVEQHARAGRLRRRTRRALCAMTVAT